MASLFGNSGSNRNQSKFLVEFRAGKMHLKGKMVNPDKRKGMVYVHQSDDGLMHFCWKDRTTGNVEDDLIIFPDDIEFKHVAQCTTGRVYILKFKSSSRKFFFWMQEPKTDKDDDYCKKVNEFLNNPPTARAGRGGGGGGGGAGMAGLPDLGSLGADTDLQGLLGNMSQQQLMQLLGGMGMGGLGNMSNLMGSPSSRSQSATPSLSTTSTASNPAPAIGTPVPVESTTPSTPATPAPSADKTPSGDKEGPRIQLSDLQSILSNMAVPADGKETVDLSKALTPEAMIPVLTKPEAQEKLLEFLPEAESLPRTAQELRNTVQSPQFQQALTTFSAALASGQLGPLMSQFGFNENVILAASQGDVEGFVKAMETEQGGVDEPEKMDEDEK